MKASLYILLPVHNRKETTKKFLLCLKKQSFQDFHLVLIDDGSTDGTSVMATTLLSEKLTILQGNGNLWWAGSLQKGLDYLETLSLRDSDVVLMINDDVEFEENFLGNGVQYVFKHPNALLLARLQDKESGQIFESGIEAKPRKLQFVEAKIPERINCLSTRGLFMRWDVCKTIGGFYPKLLPHYWSDYEYTMRAYSLGFALRTTETVFLVMDESLTGERTLAGKGFLDVVGSLFSKRSLYNPFYRISFFLLVLPWYYIPVYFLKELYAIFRILKKYFSR